MEKMSPKEEARERARLLIAWADGKTLQGFVGGTWEDWDSDESPGIAFPQQWRIKPEPRRMWTSSATTAQTENEAEAEEWRKHGHNLTEWQEVVK